MDFDLFSKNSTLFSHDRKQRSMLIILAVLILAILIVLYFGLWRSVPEPSVGVDLSVTGEIESSRDILEGLAEKIDFDANFLKSSYFKDLKVYGEWPLEVDDKGRTNPFLPY